MGAHWNHLYIMRITTVKNATSVIVAGMNLMMKMEKWENGILLPVYLPKNINKAISIGQTDSEDLTTIVGDVQHKSLLLLCIVF